MVPTNSDSDVILCIQLLIIAKLKDNLYTPLDLARFDRSLVY